MTMPELAARWRKSLRTIQRYVKVGLPGTREPMRYLQIGSTVLFSAAHIAHAEAALARSVSRAPRGNRRAKA